MQDRYKWILGCVIVVGLMTLGAAIALGHVEEKSSYGLQGILAILAKIALDFSQWAFLSKDRPKDDSAE